jgi:hypothetical protein
MAVFFGKPIHTGDYDKVGVDSLEFQAVRASGHKNHEVYAEDGKTVHPHMKFGSPAEAIRYAEEQAGMDPREDWRLKHLFEE